MIGIQLQRLVAVVGGLFELLQSKKTDRPLIPGFGKPGSVFDQRFGRPQRSTIRRIASSDNTEPVGLFGFDR